MYRELVASFKDFGVAEYRGCGKSGERFLVRETIPYSRRDLSYTLGYHGDGNDVPKGTQRACLKRLGIDLQKFYNVKRIIRPLLGFKSFWTAQSTLAGIEVIHIVRKGQLQSGGGEV